MTAKPTCLGLGLKTVNNRHSWQMTKLFVCPITPTTDCTPFYSQHQAIRDLVAASLQVVNLNGGWDVIGWCRRGEVADASANQGQETRLLTSISQFTSPTYTLVLQMP
jgi:hypothetical protein